MVFYIRKINRVNELKIYLTAYLKTLYSQTVSNVADLECYFTACSAGMNSRTLIVFSALAIASLFCGVATAVAAVLFYS